MRKPTPPATLLGCVPASILVLVCLVLAPPCRAATTSIAFYRLGEDDPGAGPSTVGMDPTFDAGPNQLNLSRFGSPHYSSDVLAKGSTVSMLFNPTTSDAYYRPPVTAQTDNVGVEAWVKSSGKAGSGSSASGVIAYNGSPGVDGFGLVRVDSATPFGGLTSAYEGVLGNTVVGLTAVPDATWTHLALVRSSGTTTFYVNGVAAGTSSAADAAGTQAFGVGASYNDQAARPVPTADYLSGLVDQVRVFSFAPGQFDAAADLSFQSAPEPASIALAALGSLGLLARRRRTA